tara:strand:+ start:47 stop:538 length:492 start_codon:yes stop_codon:yes gene_type:complete
MKKHLIPIIVFLALPFTTVESREINCNSPVWKKKEICKGKVTKKPVYILNGIEYNSLSEAGLSPYSGRDIYNYKGRYYIASRECPEGTSMFWGGQRRLLRRAKIWEMGCMTQQQADIATMQMQMQHMQRQIRTNALNNAANSLNNMMQQQQINTNQYNSTFGY